MTTNVPASSLSATGFVAPAEPDILTGVQADINAAFGGDLNPGLSTPQGQLAQSMAAIVGDKNDQFLALANGVDPAFADGRMQDAIARIYFISRLPAVATVVTGTCSGLTGTTIPLGAKAKDQAGNIYSAIQTATIPAGGSVDLQFQCSITGPITCPIGFLNAIYQAIPGWDSVTNAAAGVLGSNVESRTDFESRRQASVAKNSHGPVSAVLGNVLQVPGVLDAYAIDNASGTATGAVFSGYISGTTLTVTTLTSGTIKVADLVSVSGIVGGTTIQALGSGTGGTGTYTLNITQSAIGSSGSPVSMSSAPGGFALSANSMFICVYGGNDPDVALAIWQKKAPGCTMVGGTTVVITESTNYAPPYPSYSITFQRPTPVAIKFAISMQRNTAVPANAIDLVRAAVQAAFIGADGNGKARIGAFIFAARFYAGVAALGSWALVYSIQVGITLANQTSVLVGINQVPTLTLTDIAVTIA